MLVVLAAAKKMKRTCSERRRVVVFAVTNTPKRSHVKHPILYTSPLS
jgi:hypothetical protein